METVEVVIKIPKELYNATQTDIYRLYTENTGNIILEAIANGIPLPKGHGRLLILDEEKVKEHFTKFSFSVQDWISEVGISEATLKVIKANTESE